MNADDSATERATLRVPLPLRDRELASPSLGRQAMCASKGRTATYRDDEVYRLQVFVGYGIELVFEEGEQFVGQAGGDLDAITFGAHENHVIPKPRAANVGTNFVVYTNRRAYRFDYAVADRWPDRLSDDVIYAVRFIYPHRLYVIQAYMPSGVSAAAGACGTDACRAAARFGVTGAGFRNAWSGAAAGRR